MMMSEIGLVVFRFIRFYFLINIVNFSFVRKFVCGSFKNSCAQVTHVTLVRMYSCIITYLICNK